MGSCQGVWGKECTSPIGDSGWGIGANGFDSLWVSASEPERRCSQGVSGEVGGKGASGWGSLGGGRGAEE